MIAVMSLESSVVIIKLCLFQPQMLDERLPKPEMEQIYFTAVCEWNSNEC